MWSIRLVWISLGVVFFGDGGGGGGGCGGVSSSWTLGKGNNWLMMGIGDVELLETVVSRAEVFQSGGGSESEAAQEFHQWVLRGEDAACSLAVMIPSPSVCADIYGGVLSGTELERVLSLVEYIYYSLVILVYRS